MRVVLDTNVLISACWKASGLEARLVSLAMDGAVKVCVTQAIWNEYGEVFGREKFRSVREASRKMLDKLALEAIWLEAGERVRAAVDDDDNRFLECAVAGRAEFLITGNGRHFPSEWRGVRVVNAREFVERFGLRYTGFEFGRE